MGFFQNNKKGMGVGVLGFFAGLGMSLGAASLINKPESTPEPQAPSVSYKGVIIRTPAVETVAETTKIEPTAPIAPAAVTITDATSETHTYNVDSKKFTLSQRVLNALNATGLPVEALIATCARESACQPEQINPKSDACGLFQFLPSTLNFSVYKYLPEQRHLIERFVEKRDENNNPYFGYRPASETAKTELSRLCLQPEFNAALYAVYTKPKIEQYNAWLFDREITVGELVVLNNLGVHGLKNFAQQAWADKKAGTDTLAKDFFNARIAEQNPSLIRGCGIEQMTVRQSYNCLINEFGGWETLEVASR